MALYTEKLVDGDIVRTSVNNGYELVSDKDKCSQDVKMVLSTEVRDNGLGASLETVIGDDITEEVSAFSNVPFMFDFQLRVQQSLNRLKELQRSYQFSQRTSKELLYEFSPVNVWPIPEDPRSYNWEVYILTVSGGAATSITGSTPRR